MIVQELRHIQERLGWLPHEEMKALAQRLGVPQHRIHEVASFYPLYKLSPPKAVEVKICRDMACHLRGAKRIIDDLAAFGNEIGGGEVVVEGVSCLGQCDNPVALLVNDHHVYFGRRETDIRELIHAALRKRPMPHQRATRERLPGKIDVYGGTPEYRALKQFVSWGDQAADRTLKELEKSGLKGLGGAGFPTFRKWSAVRGCSDPVKYVVCNADESEPGTFKDRELMRRAPWLVIEGMVLAALVVGAEKGYLYLRHEYPEEAEVLEHAILEAKTRYGVVGDNVLGTGRKFDLELYISPGGYVQGEESALLEAIEDKRGEPRNKPPFPVYQGLFGKPTVINNVETLSWTPGILLNGGEWYSTGGTNGFKGMRWVSISGDVVKPGVYETPFGLSVRDLVMRLAGGMRDGMKLKAVAPSGPSGGFLPAILRRENMPPKFVDEFMKGKDTFDTLNLLMDNSVLGAAGSMLGAAFVVYGDKADMVDNALNCTEFFRNESCGKCVPCRTGSQKLVDMMTDLVTNRYKAKVSLPLVSELADTMILTSICGLGQVASNPVSSVIRHFRAEVDAYLRKNGQKPS